MPTPIVVNDTTGEEEEVGVRTATVDEEAGLRQIHLDVGGAAHQDGAEAMSAAGHEMKETPVSVEMERKGRNAWSVGVRRCGQKYPDG